MSVSLDNLEPIDVRPIKRALISVYDKTGLEDLARALGEAGVEIVSTGSTAARIAAAGVAVTPVDDVTGFPEVLEGEGLRSRVGGAVGSSAYEREPLVGLRPVLDGEGDCHL